MRERHGAVEGGRFQQLTALSVYAGSDDCHLDRPLRAPYSTFRLKTVAPAPFGVRGARRLGLLHRDAGEEHQQPEAARPLPAAIAIAAIAVAATARAAAAAAPTLRATTICWALQQLWKPCMGLEGHA